MQKNNVMAMMVALFFCAFFHTVSAQSDRSEPNNSFSEADFIVPGSMNNLSLPNGDEDYFYLYGPGNVKYYAKVSSKEGGSIASYSVYLSVSSSIYISASEDTELYLYDEHQRQLASNDEGNGTFSGTRIYYTPGTTNPLPASSADPHEPNDSFSQAKGLGSSSPISLNDPDLTSGDRDLYYFFVNSRKYYVKVVGYSSSTTGKYGLRINSSSSNITVETFGVSGSTDTKLYLYDRGESQLAYDDDSGSGSFSRVSYDIATTDPDPTPPTSGADPYEANDSFSQAKSIGGNVSIRTTELTARDNDYYYFNLSNKVYYVKVVGYSSSTAGKYGLRVNSSSSSITVETFSIDGNTDTKLYLYDKDQKQLAYDDDGGSGNFSKVSYDVPGADPNPPCFSCDPYEENNSFASAKRLENNSSVDTPYLTGGDQDYFYFYSNGTKYYIKIMGYSSSNSGKYGVRISSSATTITVETFSVSGSTTYTDLYLYDQNQRQLAYNTGHGWSFAKLTYNIPPADTNDPYESNDSFYQAKNVSSLVTINSLSLTAGDQDYFYFFINNKKYYIKVIGNNSYTVGKYGLSINSSSSSMIIRTFLVDNASMADTKLYLYDQFENQLAYDNDSGNGSFSFISYTIPANNGRFASPDTTVDADYEIYPNPASTSINVKTLDDTSIRNVKLINTSGKVEKSWSGDELSDLDISGLVPGVYLLQIETNSTTEVQRLVIQ